MFTLLIRNARIADGTGAASVFGDIGVEGDRIAAIGDIPEQAEAERTVDASGLAAAPGFIDIHTHADIALLARPRHLPKVMQGVTTEVFTNCGLGFAPVTGEGLEIQRRYLSGLFGDDGNRANRKGTDGNGTGESEPDSNRVTWNWRSVADFLAQFEAQGIGANVVYLIPHGSVRVSAMGMAERAADAAELARMRALVAAGMEEGAWGLSTGIWYAPMRSAAREELVVLCREAGFFATHQRDYGAAIFEATEESLAIAREAEVPVQIAHLQMNGEGNRGRAGELLSVLKRARTAGVDVTCDTYPYTAGSTLIQTLLPPWAVDGGPDAILPRLVDEEARARIVDALSSPTEPRDWSAYRLVGAQSKQNRGLEGLSFTAAAAARNLPVAEWVCAVLQEDELRACYVHHAAHEGNVRDILKWEGQMVGSDGLHLPGKTHPRLYGTFPRVLGHYVRDAPVLGLEQAVHKMTGAPAARLGLKRRGLLREGFAADIVLFDPLTVRDTATFEDPLQYPVGIPYVFVNGMAAKWADAPTGALAGRVLRRQ